MSNKYSQSKICNKCGHEDSRENSKCVAAFESTRMWESPCPICQSIEIENAGWELPDLDEEIMLLWCDDESLYLSDQDEDILMAEEMNIDLLFNFLDNDNIKPSKRAVILSALCVLVFDNTSDEEEDLDINPEIAIKVIHGLKGRISIFASMDTDYIMDYIKEVVYPQLGLSLRSM